MESGGSERVGAGCGGEVVRCECRSCLGNGRLESVQAENEFVKLFAEGEQGGMEAAGGLGRL